MIVIRLNFDLYFNLDFQSLFPGTSRGDPDGNKHLFGAFLGHLVI